MAANIVEEGERKGICVIFIERAALSLSRLLLVFVLLVEGHGGYKSHFPFFILRNTIHIEYFPNSLVLLTYI
jgi:hypothetical protein